eukprot:Em0015g77a
MAIKWWLGLNTSPGSPPCALCPEHPLDPLGHHAVTCKRGGDAISRHNKLRDVVLQTCHRACISAKAEAGSGLGHELRNTRPADILASNWLCGKPAAFDLTVVSPLNPTFISEAGRTAGSAAVAAELRKHSANEAKCSELGWTCIPLVAESYGAWGSEAVASFFTARIIPCHKDQLPQVQGSVEDWLLVVDGMRTTSLKDGMRTASLEDGMRTGSLKDSMRTASLEEGMRTGSLEDGMRTASLKDGMRTASLEEGMRTASLEDGMRTASLKDGMRTMSLKDKLLLNVIMKSLMCNRARTRCTDTSTLSRCTDTSTLSRCALIVTFTSIVYEEGFPTVEMLIPCYTANTANNRKTVNKLE